MSLQERVSTSQSLVNEISRKIGGLGLDLHDTADNVRQVAETFQHQSEQFPALRRDAEGMIGLNRDIARESLAAQETSRRAEERVRDSNRVIESAVRDIAALIEAVGCIEDRLAALDQSLKRVSSFSGSIDTIARQTNLLALNAAIEAARAGEMGKGFAVVAAEVKSLSQQTREATLQIGETVRVLTSEVGSLIEETALAIKEASRVRESSDSIGTAIGRLGLDFASVSEVIEIIAQAAGRNVEHCNNLQSELDDLDRMVESSTSNLQSADRSIQSLLDVFEILIDEVGTSGVETDDSAYVQHAVETAARIEEAINQALAEGRVKAEQLFDDRYTEIAGTNPQQFMHDSVPFFESILPHFIEPALTALPRVALSVCLSRDGFLPVHNAKYSHPQRPDDPAWNAVNSRNRLFFKHRAALTASNAGTPKLVTMRRELGGKFIMLKLASAPVHAAGRLWGAYAVCYLPG